MVTVTTSQGTLKGGESVTEGGHKYYEFLSVPYAKPPVGDLRFKSPQLPEPWDGERDATTSVMENTPCQRNFMTGQISGSEDCLYLNVYTPKLPSSGSKPLPVMLFIHGGGFIYGNGIMKSEGYPEYLLDNDVVVVTINYRLGVFGFLSLDIPEASGNMGLKDQVKALEWVQKNIDKFGGDKDNVTIFGISAGSASVEYLMLSRTARGLFHKAILQSGSSLDDWAINFQYKELTLNLANKLGYKGDSKDKQALYEFLLKVPAAELSDAGFYVTENFTAKSIFFGFVPIVEKDFGDAFITDLPYKLLKEGQVAQIPVIRGFCNVEGSLMNMMKPFAVNELIGNKNFVHFWSYELESEDQEKYGTKFRNVYLEKAKAEDEPDSFAVDFFGDLHFVAGIWLASKFFVRNGITEYVYKFAYDGKLNAFKLMFGLMKKGAAHGDDTGYFLKNDIMKGQAPDDIDILVRTRMNKMWSNFAKTGEPTPTGDADFPVQWPKFTEDSKAYLNINKDVTIETNYEPERMAVFEEIYAKYEK